MTESKSTGAVGRHADLGREVYAAAVSYLWANGWRREELGSGWWWKADCDEQATLGGALEQQLDADGIDQRDATAGEPQGEYWG